ncbi:unnamed protein product [Durusdinium trenchii]|uniref:Uncharacterized protein n=2 Tax=Durusdinium trenchii TaxID=1381693 RepID=A0ABP0NFK8_9DINO
MADLKVIPTLQVALFVGSWITSWWSLVTNAFRVTLGGHGFDIVYAAPVAVLLLGLFMTNLQGFLEEKRRGDMPLAKAAALDLDLACLLHRHGKELCAGKPIKAWDRLKVRQALGRGIPLSMVSFYIASRSLVEAPACQLLMTLSRNVIEGTNMPSKVAEFVDSHPYICQMDLPFGFGLGCVSNHDALLFLEDWTNVPNNLQSLNSESKSKMHDVEGTIWKAAHCQESTFSPGKSERCSYELCGGSDLPNGSIQAFNEVATLLAVAEMKNSDELRDSLKSLVFRFTGEWLLSAAIPYNMVINAVLNRVSVSGDQAFIIKSWRHWQPQVVLGALFLIASMLPLSKLIERQRRLKEQRHKIPILVHLSLDILLLESASVFMLTSHFINRWGDAVIDAARQLTLAIATGLNTVEVSTTGSLADLKKEIPKRVWTDEFMMKMLNAVESMKEPLEVDEGLLGAFVAAALFFYSVSTVLCRDNSVCRSQMWIARWNAAVGGPLHLLGSVQEEEVRQLCQPIRLQILLRGFLLSFLLGCFFAPSNGLDALASTALVFNIKASRTPWIISWLFLWATHAITGVLAVMAIEENQQLRDEDRMLKDMEAYGSINKAPVANHAIGTTTATSGNGLPSTQATQPPELGAEQGENGSSLPPPPALQDPPGLGLSSP